MKFPECQDVIAYIVGLGPVASEALPLLRRMASDPQHQWAVQAALAIYAADDSTNLLAETISRALAKPDGFHDFDRELFWFREDERLNRVVVPLLSSVLTNTARSFLERNLIAGYLGEVRTSDPLPGETLKLVLEQNPDEELRKTVLEALAKQAKMPERNAP
jgi:hypothetical protein